LGLSVVYNIIDAHQGKIYIESEEGKGTIVNLYLKIS
jgi:signal transduction histidine kinase